MKMNTFRIILIVIILIVVLTVIVIGIIYLIKYIKKRRAKKTNQNELSNNSINTSTQPSTNLSVSQNVLNTPRIIKINAFCECFLKPVKYNKIKIYNDSCPIDFIKFKENGDISVTQCYHGFHYDCIRKYLLEKETNDLIKCPICNSPLFSLKDKSFQLG